MNWHECTVQTTSDGADLVSYFLTELGATGTQILDRADIPDPQKPHGYWELIDESIFDAMPLEVEVKAWFEADADLVAIRRQFMNMAKESSIPLGTLLFGGRPVEDAAWRDVWKQYYKPFRLGERFVIKPSWEDYDAAPGDLVLELDPGMAFGTGSHETTAMCLMLIEKYHRKENLLDVGTGSGILAIAAGKLGVDRVDALDIDPDAVLVAKENVKKNGLAHRVNVFQGDLLQGIDTAYTVVVANILADVILLLLPALTHHLSEGGTFLCSGIIKEKLPEVESALTAQGYQILEVMAQGDWRAIAAKRG